MSVRLFASVVAAVLIVGTAGAQSDRRDRQNPELIVESGGRLGSCDSLQFTRDGKYALAIGDDKVVRSWPYRDGQLQTDGMRVLRWTIWHEQRGAIFALALSPDTDNKHVAIAGIGQPTSTVAILDRVTGKMLQHVVAVPPKGENSNALWSLAYAPDGQHVAFGDSYGGVWTWDFAGAAVRLGKHDRQGQVNIVRFVHFFDATTLVSVAEDGTARLWDLSRQPVRRVNLKDFDTGGRPIYRVALSPDEKWYAAAATKNPAKPAENLLVVVRSVDGTQSYKIELEKHEFARAVAFDAGSERLAVTIGRKLEQSDFAMEGEDRIVFYDLKKDLAATDGPRGLYRAEFLAFHPNGKDLAIATGENHEVTLWHLGDWKKPVSIMTGAGRSLWGVALSKDGNQIAFRNQRNPQALDPNDRGQGPWRVFHLQQHQWTDPADFKPVQQWRTWKGWTIEPDRGNAYVWYARTPEGTDLKLPLDERRDGMPRCYTFLPPAGKLPLRLAVGHLWGVSIYELTPTAAKRVRLCTGHQADVTAVAATADGSYLVSASMDQTLAGWNLVDNWPSQPTLGAGFEIKGDKLYVKKVDLGSPAWEAGLVVGDEVVSFHLHGDPNPLEGGPPAWQAALEDPLPGVEHGFKVRRGGRTQTPLGTSVRQRPLWRFFPTPEGEWVLWMWQGSYYTTSTKGDSYIGWHVNAPDLAHEPAFYRAEQFREPYQRDDVLDVLLKTHNVQAALREATDGNPLPPFNAQEPPFAALRTAAATTKTDDVPVTLTATPHGTNPDYQPVRTQLWINALRYDEDRYPETWERDGTAFHKTLTIPNAKLRPGDNVVTFQVYNRAGGRAEAATTLHCTRPPVPPRLWGLAVGVNKYNHDERLGAVGGGVAAVSGRGADVAGPGEYIKLGDLVNADSDAEAIQKSWQAQQGLYTKTGMFLQLDDKAKRARIIDALDELADKVGPEDHCIIFLAGHGVFVKHNGMKKPLAGVLYAVTPCAVYCADWLKEWRPTTWLFCGPDFDGRRPEETGLSSEVLYEKLAKIAGHKLVILDACHSGEAAVNPVRSLVPGGQGPFIMAACDINQSAYENKTLQHGLFTYALLQVIEGKYRPENKRELDADDLYRYTKQQMPKLLKDVGESEFAQVPALFAPKESAQEKRAQKLFKVVRVKE